MTTQPAPPPAETSRMPRTAPQQTAVTLTLDTAELARWTAAAERDGAASLEQWLRVLAMSRVGAMRPCETEPT